MRKLAAFLIGFAFLATLTPVTGRGEVIINEDFAKPLDPRIWTVDPAAQVADGKLVLPTGKPLMLRNVTTETAVAVSFKCRLMETGSDPYLVFRCGPVDRRDRYTMILRPSGLMEFTDNQARKQIFRALGYLDPLKRACEVTIRLYPKGRRLTYDADGAFYGERILADDEMAGLGTLTAFTFFAHPKTSEWSKIRIETIPDRPAPLYKAVQSAKPELPVFPKTKRIAKRLVFLDPTPLSPADQFLATGLQGVVNQSEARIYLGYHHYVQLDTAEDWRPVLKAGGHILDPAPDLSGLVATFQRQIKGVILYDARAWDSRQYPALSHQINIATTAAGILQAVPVTPEQQARCFPRTPVVLDLRDRWTNARDAYAWAWKEYWHRCNPSAIAHLENATYCTPIRDYVIANKLFAFLSSDVRNEADFRFYMDMLAAGPANTPVIGMTALLYGPRSPQAVFDEDGLFRYAGEVGKFFVYAFSSGNLSVHSAVNINTLRPKPGPSAPKLDPSKVYLAFMISEGENLSWSMDLRAAAFHADRQVPVPRGWSLTGAMMDMCPAILRYYYARATPSDAFFLDGAGIADHYNLNTFGLRLDPAARDAAHRRFLELTRLYMDRMGLTMVRPFDPTTSLPRHTLEQYVRGLPGMTALFTGYNAELGLADDEAREFMIDNTPVFRTRVSSAESRSDEYNADVLVKNIRKASTGARPAFLNVFVLGNYAIHGTRCLQLVMNQLGPDYVALRPEHFAAMFKESQKTSK